MAMDNGKNQLVSVPQNLCCPASMSGKDFKVKTPSEGAYEEGKDQLYKQSENQVSPRQTEDEGDNKPTPTDRSAKISANFKVAKSSAEGGKSVGAGVSVDFGDGNHASPDQKK